MAKHFTLSHHGDGLKKRFFSLCMLCALGAIQAFAASSGAAIDVAPMLPEAPASSDYVAKGQVVDAAGEPIIGATVMEKGASNGMVTDLNGNYSLKVKSRQSVLLVSYVGFTAREVSAGVGRVVLTEDSQNLNELVVIGYGTQRKGDVTSAITSIKDDDFLQGKIADAAELIKGKVAGLSIVQSSGDPNASSSIMLRGITTIMGSVEPLVLVDGIEGSLTTVAPENVAEIDVLKDASAAAIYCHVR